MHGGWIRVREGWIHMRRGWNHARGGCVEARGDCIETHGARCCARRGWLHSHEYGGTAEFARACVYARCEFNTNLPYYANAANWEVPVAAIEVPGRDRLGFWPVVVGRRKLLKEKPHDKDFFRRQAREFTLRTWKFTLHAPQSTLHAPQSTPVWSKRARYGWISAGYQT
eukprot:424510-Prorocentrum_minimum.AAC.1